MARREREEPQSPREKLEGKPNPGNVPTQSGAASATAGATGATHPSGITGDRTGASVEREAGVVPKGGVTGTEGEAERIRRRERQD